MSCREERKLESSRVSSGHISARARSRSPIVIPISFSYKYPPGLSVSSSSSSVMARALFALTLQLPVLVHASSHRIVFAQRAHSPPMLSASTYIWTRSPRLHWPAALLFLQRRRHLTAAAAAAAPVSSSGGNLYSPHCHHTPLESNIF